MHAKQTSKELHSFCFCVQVKFLNATVNLFTDRIKSEFYSETENEALSPALQQSCRGSPGFPLSKVEILNVFIKHSFKGVGNCTKDVTGLKTAI